MKDILISYFPFLILIGVWIFFMNRFRNGGSTFQNECLDVAKAQMDATRDIARQLDRIANALEAHEK